MFRRGSTRGPSCAGSGVLLTIGLAALHLLLPGDAASMPPAEKPQVTVKLNTVTSNYDCYVCHIPFVQESLAAVHAKAAVWCGRCHGPSIAHIEDENIGATPPDVVFEKHAIDRMCAECHDPEEHSRLKGNTRSERLAAGKKAQQEIKGRKISVTGVCTDCHGSHWIPPREQPAGSDSGTASTPAAQQAPAGAAQSDVLSADNPPNVGKSVGSCVTGRCRSMVPRFLDTGRSLQAYRRGILRRRPIGPDGACWRRRHRSPGRATTQENSRRLGAVR